MKLNLSLYLETRDMPTYTSRVADLLERYAADLRQENARMLVWDPNKKPISGEKAIFYPAGAIKVEIEEI